LTIVGKVLSIPKTMQMVLKTKNQDGDTVNSCEEKQLEWMIDVESHQSVEGASNELTSRSPRNIQEKQMASISGS